MSSPMQWYDNRYDSISQPPKIGFPEIIFEGIVAKHFLFLIHSIVRAHKTNASRFLFRKSYLADCQIQYRCSAKACALQAHQMDHLRYWLPSCLTEE